MGARKSHIVEVEVEVEAYNRCCCWASHSIQAVCMVTLDKYNILQQFSRCIQKVTICSQNYSFSEHCLVYGIMNYYDDQS